MKSRCNSRSLFNTGPHWAAALLCVAVLAWAGAAGAQLPIPASSQFDITGFIEEATLDLTCATDAHCGGTIKVNGHVVTVPKETIVIFPANALTWQELFVQAPLPWGLASNGATAVNTSPLGGPTSGMAMADCAAGAAGACTAPPLTTWEAQVIGNRVLAPNAGPADQYIAGLIYVSQQALNSGAGFINFIDYTTGEMRVGGVLNDPTTGARVRLNDPAGRYGRATTSPDIRFTVDPDNPTITAGSGYPMCLPRTAPSGVGVGTDALCPEQNRPIGLNGPVTQFTTANNSNPAFPLQPGVFPDSTIQAPFEVGDYITFAGTLVADCATCLGGGTTVGPWPALGTPATWIAAHTIEANVSILTFQGSNPVYVRTDVTILGTGGLTVLGVGEAAIRTRFEGMMSDLTRAVHLFGMDLTSTGVESDRDWGTIGVDPGPPLGAVTGRWRFRPPCLPFGTVPTKPDKQCVMNQAGTFLPVTREVRAVVYDPAALAPGFANPGLTTTDVNGKTVANGLIWGQYHAPILEYIFPENVPGSPIVENNFNTMPFLAQGGYTSSAGTLVGVLNPWPSNVLPTPSCTAPVANAGGPYSVVVTGTVTLAGSATGTPAPSLLWSVPVGTGTLSSTTIANPVYTAPGTAQTVTASLTATNTCGSNTATATINVLAAQPPTLTAINAQTVPAGTSVRLQTVATDPLKLKVAVSFNQTGGTPTVFNPNPNRQPATGFSNSGSTFTSPSFTVTTAQIPAGAASVTLTFSVTATNQSGVTSSAVPTSVTFTRPVAGDTVTITSVEDRTGKQRVIVNATESVVSATVNLFLNPYQCQVSAACPTGTYNPDPAAGGVGNQFTNNGGGLYIITLVGAPQPLCNPGGAFATPCSATPITVRSSLGATSAPSAVTKIRQ